MLAVTLEKGTCPLGRFAESADVSPPMSRSSRSLSSSAGRESSSGSSGSDGSSDRMLLQGAVSGSASGSNWLQQQQPADLLSGQLRLNPSAEIYTPAQALGHAPLPPGSASFHRHGTSRPGVATAKVGTQTITDESGKFTTGWRGIDASAQAAATSEYLSLGGGDASRQVGQSANLYLCIDLPMYSETAVDHQSHARWLISSAVCWVLADP